MPRDPGILCAQGLIVADRKEEFVRSKRLLLDNASMETLRQLTDTLGRDADAWFREEAPFDGAQRRLTTIVYDMRYVGQNFELSVLDTEQPAQTPDADRLKRLFFAAHEASYGFHNPDDAVEIINIRLTASVTADALRKSNWAQEQTTGFEGKRSIYFEPEQSVEATIYQRGALRPGQVVAGPAAIDQLDATTIVYPGDRAVVDENGNLYSPHDRACLQIRSSRAGNSLQCVALDRRRNLHRAYAERLFDCSAPGSLDTSLSHAAGLIEIAACHA